MLDSGTIVVLITCIASVICVLSLYSVYGNVIRHETTLHDLRNRVELLQNEQTLRIAVLKGEISPLDAGGSVEILDDDDSPFADVEIVEDYPAEEPVSSSTKAA